MSPTIAHPHTHPFHSHRCKPLTRAKLTNRQLLLYLTALLLLCDSAAGQQQQPQQQQNSRFFYASTLQPASPDSSAPSKVRRETSEVQAADAAAADAASCCQGAAAGLFSEPALLELSNVTDYGESDGGDSSAESSKETYKRSVSRSYRIATPASCSPQPTIVELKPLPEEGMHISATVSYQPACTRVNRCNGCCGSTLISCQPTQTEVVQLRVNKVERIGNSVKRGHAFVNVEQHLACKCDCRTKADDCNAYQLYRKDLCRCQCQNTDARDKCLEQHENKYWDDANCTCACRYNQSCTTGTVFDETLCKCTDPNASEVLDRKRFIVQAVAVEPDNSTLYSF